MLAVSDSFGKDDSAVAEDSPGEVVRRSATVFSSKSKNQPQHGAKDVSWSSRSRILDINPAHPHSRLLEAVKVDMDYDSSIYSEEEDSSQQHDLDFESDENAKEQTSSAATSSWSILEPEEMARVQVGRLTCCHSMRHLHSCTALPSLAVSASKVTGHPG